MANDILKLLHTNRNDIKQLFQNMIIACGNNNNNINDEIIISNLSAFKGK